MENIPDAAERIEYYRTMIENLRKSAGLQDSVTLLAATKTVDAARINEAVRKTGLRDIGENRVQELLEKYDALDKENLNIHFIGSLQCNKVKYIIDKVCMIQSLDSVSLAKEIDRLAKKHGIKMDVLIEINIGREENKGGVYPENLDSFIDEISRFDSLNIKGFMTIAPICEKKEDKIGYFRETYKIFVDILTKKKHNIDISVLSMGMTDSYAEAVSCGSNMVRIGSGIFGKRNYPQKNDDQLK